MFTCELANTFFITNLKLATNPLIIIPTSILDTMSKRILVFALVLAAALSLDYYLSAQNSLYIGNLEKITVLGDQLGVISSGSVFTLLTGTNYQNQVTQYNCNTPSSNIKVTPQGVFINSGAFVTRRDLT